MKLNFVCKKTLLKTNLRKEKKSIFKQKKIIKILRMKKGRK